MLKRTYKDTGKEISVLGYGLMRLPTEAGESQKIDYKKAEELIDYAYRNGVNYFDTALPYHEGDSENFVGYALSKYPRESYFLADKMPAWVVHSMEDVERIFEDQLKKCRTDYFDFYLCHSLSEGGFKIYEEIDIYGYLAKQKEAGRIRKLGFSFHDTPAVLEKIVSRYPWDFTQLQINYMDWDFLDAKRMYEILEERSLPCIVMEPVRGGALATLCPEAVQMLKEAEPDMSPASWAIRFAASLPNVMTVLSGMSTLEQVKDNVATMSNFRPISEADRKVLERVIAAYRKSKTVPCTGCRYCMDCPSGVDIPLMFREYNEYAITGDKDDYIRRLRAIAKEKYAKNCVNCKKCMEHCPQAIAIPERLKEVAWTADALHV